MATTDVDKVNGFIIRKRHSKDRSKVFGFIAVPVDYDGKDYSKIQEFPNLTAAREALGAPKPAPKITLPKSAYRQNQKGYDPHKR